MEAQSPLGWRVQRTVDQATIGDKILHAGETVDLVDEVWQKSEQK